MTLGDVDGRLVRKPTTRISHHGTVIPEHRIRSVTALVPIECLSAGDSPRLDGCNEEHVERLAEVDAPLPPLLVDRRTMRVIDGWHRMQAALLRGWTTVEVEYFEGNSADAFLRAVQANVKHGYPLSQADRRAAAARIIVSHPVMSDRAIAAVAGLGAKTVAVIRSGVTGPQPATRIGRDGRARPLNGVEGRLRAAELFTERPEASLREVARIAGVSPATAGDVRKRMERGEFPAPIRAEPARTRPEPVPVVPVVPVSVVRKLVLDPSLRHKEEGRRLLRLLQQCAIEADDWAALIAAVPPHCTDLVRQLALQYAQTWSTFADQLGGRAQVTSTLNADG